MFIQTWKQYGEGHGSFYYKLKNGCTEVVNQRIEEEIISRPDLVGLLETDFRRVVFMEFVKKVKT